jgi:hypothetical protein
MSLSFDDQQQLIFTFRIAIPHDTPHSLIATSCKYYYLIALRLVSTNNDGYCQQTGSATTTITSADATSTEWIQMPLSVLTAHPSFSIPLPVHDDEGPVAVVQAMAHSTGLPTHLSATELASWEGEYTVCNPTGSSAPNSSIVQSMRVDDPVTGRPVCVLSILGTAPTSLVPGSRLILKFDFPQQPIMESSSGGSSPWMPCASVSACLQGQEMVVTAGKAASRRRARRFVFGTAHEWVSSTTTECVSLTLILPETAPCSIATPHVEISVQCLVDIAISQDAKKFRNLRLEIPCRVQHALADWELPRPDDDDGQAQVECTLRELWQQSLPPTRSIPRFDSHDIVDDLKILSLDLVRRPKSNV